MKRDLTQVLPIIPALAIFAVLAYHLNFTQDDAYISYRYAANYLDGHGLVYNIGERVEGFTNFGWTIYLILLGVLKLDYIVWSKITGFLCGVGVVVLTYAIARRLLRDNAIWFAAAAACLAGASQSLAYWSPAGLETAAFTLAAMFSLYWYLKRSPLLGFGLLMAVWIRPEGAVVAGVLIVAEAIESRGWPRFSLTCALGAFLFSLPWVVFKLLYYKSILPNPFYAKTSFNLGQFMNGLEYTGQFASDYPIYAAAFAAALVMSFGRRLSGVGRTVMVFAGLYSLYVLLVGGDVLKVHRFHLPVIGPLAVLVVLVLNHVTARLPRKTQVLVVVLFLIAALPVTYILPRGFVEHYNFNEKAFTEKMQFKAREMKQSDPHNFSVAVATIGIFGYELLGHEIIDMLGLTDSTIARYSEDPIPGMETTWKEQKHNTKYLLQRAPDYIIFSTGIKPSAPAERALLLYRQFMDSYRTVGWYYKHPKSPRGVISSAFKRIRPIEGEIVPVYPVEYVQYYKTALDYHTKGDHANAVKYYDLAAKASPQPYFVYLIYQKAFSLTQLGEYERAIGMLNALLQRDSTVFEAHMDLYRFALVMGDTAKAEIHKRWLQQLVPWYWPRIESATQAALRGQQ